MTTPTVEDPLESLGTDYRSSVVLPSGSTTVYPGCDTTGSNHSTPIVRDMWKNLGSDYTPGH
jgi:hypothetical protein